MKTMPQMYAFFCRVHSRMTSLALFTFRRDRLEIEQLGLLGEPPICFFGRGRRPHMLYKQMSSDKVDQVIQEILAGFRGGRSKKRSHSVAGTL